MFASARSRRRCWTLRAPRRASVVLARRGTSSSTGRCRWQGKLAAVAIEATTGWRWVWRELSARGFAVRLVDPAQAKALRGRIKRAKTDRLDARWLCVLLAKEMLPESWLPPAEIEALRDQTRLRKALAEDRTRRAQRLHVLLTHKGWPCQRARLLTVEGRRWAASLSLSPAARAQVDRLLRLIEAVESELRALETELRRLARRSALRGVADDLRRRADPGLSPVAELGEAARFAARGRRSALPGSIRSSMSRARRDAAAGSPSTAHPYCDGRWSKQPSTPSAPTAPTMPCTCRRRRVSAASVQRSRSRARSAVAPITSYTSSRPRPPD
jgi:transposase